MIDTALWHLELKNYWVTFLRFIFPANCLLCHQTLLLDEAVLCSSCFDHLPRLKHPQCQKCALEIPPYHHAATNVCQDCRNEKRFFDQGTAFYRYQDGMKTLMRAAKFNGMPWAFKVFKPDFQQTLTPLPIAQYDMIVPVPLDWWRVRQRDYNQAHLLAAYLERGGQTPRIRQALLRSRHRQPQSLLNREQRKENLRNLFRVDKKIPVHGKTILLVDDVVTTGATMNECARTLKQHGAKRVDFVALARTVTL